MVKGSAIQSVHEQISGNLRPMPSTMKIHQLIIEEVASDSILARDVSCFCAHPSQCRCFEPRTHELRTGKLSTEREANVPDATTYLPAEKEKIVHFETVRSVDESLIGRFVVVLYDGMPLHGVVLAVDEDDIEVKSMHRVGVNRFFWPMIDDVLWYSQDKITTLLPAEPEHVTSRHCQIPSALWKEIEKALGV